MSRPLQHSEKLRLQPPRSAEVRKALIDNKLGDKLLVYILWTLLAPGVAITLGAVGAVEAIKPTVLYTFDIGVAMAGFGELVTKSTELHRRMLIMLFLSCSTLLALVFCWILSTGGAVLPSSWWTASTLTFLTAVIVGCDIVVGVTRDAHEEVKSWVR